MPDRASRAGPVPRTPVRARISASALLRSRSATVWTTTATASWTTSPPWMSGVPPGTVPATSAATAGASNPCVRRRMTVSQARRATGDRSVRRYRRRRPGQRPGAGRRRSGAPRRRLHLALQLQFRIPLRQRCLRGGRGRRRVYTGVAVRSRRDLRLVRVPAGMRRVAGLRAAPALLAGEPVRPVFLVEPMPGRTDLQRERLQRGLYSDTRFVYDHGPVRFESPGSGVRGQYLWPLHDYLAVQRLASVRQQTPARAAPAG